MIVIFFNLRPELGNIFLCIKFTAFLEDVRLTVICILAFWKIISKRMVSIFLMHLTTIQKIKIIFAIFCIFYGIQDNYTEKMAVHLTTIQKIEIILAIFYIFYGIQDNYTEKIAGT